MPTSTSRKLTTLHPLSLFCFPPAMRIKNVTNVTSSNSAAADIMNATLFHIEQKYVVSTWQSSSCGKERQVVSSDEQLLCRPRVLVNLPLGDSTCQPIQFGMIIEASVIAVAMVLSAIALMCGAN